MTAYLYVSLFLVVLFPPVPRRDFFWTGIGVYFASVVFSKRDSLEAIRIFNSPLQGTGMEIRKPGPLKQLNAAGDQVFEQLFKTHFRGLHTYACTILRDSHLAEEIVQIVFVKLYERSDRIYIETSLEAYLYRSVYYESLNHRKHEKIKARYRSFAARHVDQTSTIELGSNYRELEIRLQKALEELPEQCRTIFQLSRFEGLKYREIAHRLGLSVKTVENQMGKALRILRGKLMAFLSVILILLYTIK